MFPDVEGSKTMRRGAVKKGAKISRWAMTWISLLGRCFSDPARDASAHDDGAMERSSSFAVCRATADAERCIGARAPPLGPSHLPAAFRNALIAGEWIVSATHRRRN
jgi:hypothetical protein